MPEMAHSGEHHCETALVGGADHFFVAKRAARLDNRGDTGIGGGDEPVGERKESIGGDDSALSAARGLPHRPCRFLCLQYGDAREMTRLIWPAPMATVAPFLA